MLRRSRRQWSRNRDRPPESSKTRQNKESRAFHQKSPFAHCECSFSPATESSCSNGFSGRGLWRSCPRREALRAGETAWSLTGQQTGLTDLPLTPHGEAVARSLAGREDEETGNSSPHLAPPITWRSPTSLHLPYEIPSNRVILIPSAAEI